MLTKKLAQIEVALAAGLLRALSLGRMIGHRLDAQATGASEAVENKGRARDQAADRAEDTAATLRSGHGGHGHLHRGIFPQPRARLYVQRLTGCQHLLKDVAIAVQQDHTLAAATGELVDKDACAAEQDIGRALHKGEVVIDVAGGEEELVLTHLNHLAWLQAQHDDLPHRIARERDIARSLSLVDKDLQAREEAPRRALQRLKAQLHAWMFPEQDMVLKVD